MARKDQKHFFLLACIGEDPFFAFMKESGSLTIKHWAYLNPIRHWREKLSILVQNSKGIGDIKKQRRAAFNKAIEFFKMLPHDEITVEYYLNFLMGLASDLAMECRNKCKQQILGKIEENLFKLYVLYDPEIKQDQDMDMACRDLKKVQEVF